MTTKHTPGPLSVDPYNENRILDNSGREIAICGDIDGGLNAAFIVTACNAHDKLASDRADLIKALDGAAEALELAAELFDELTPSRTNPGMCRINARCARAAIAKGES